MKRRGEQFINITPGERKRAQRHVDTLHVTGANLHEHLAQAESQWVQGGRPQALAVVQELEHSIYGPRK
jgi:hypothetical protein